MNKTNKPIPLEKTINTPPFVCIKLTIALNFTDTTIYFDVSSN